VGKSHECFGGCLMERSSKCWGERWSVYKDTTLEICVLILQAGFRCSYHYHEHKYNKFVVISGRLSLKTQDGSYSIEAGQEFTVNPLEMHEFQVREPTVVIEVMYVKYDENDIIRKIEGGKLPSADVFTIT